MKIIAAADGSALGNPGPAGWGWYADDAHWAAGGWPHGTNNMGELMAVLDLLQQSAHLDAELHILCDSQYVINSVTKWMPGWKRNGWRKKDGKPVLNVDLMKAIDEAMQGRRVTFEWVKGHAGHDLNEKADDLANGAATAYQAGGIPDAGPGFGAARAATPAPPSQPEPEPDLFALFDDLGSAPAPTQTSTDGSTPTATDGSTPTATHGSTPTATHGSTPTATHGSTPTAPNGSAPQDSAIDEVIAGERALLTDAVRADRQRVGALIHPDWQEIGRSGYLYSRDAMLAGIAPLASPVTLEVLNASAIDDNSILLVWRAVTAERSTLRSSLWVRTPQGWLQRFHQGTSEA